MSQRKKLKKLFEAGDGRKASADVLIVRKGEKAILHSNGWDCNDCDNIQVYKFLQWGKNKCEEAFIALWTEDVNVDPLSSVEIPRVRLTGYNKSDVIDEAGQYILIRVCGAEDVNVWSKYESK